MRVLITGHRGFIGRHFWDHFALTTDAQLFGVDIALDGGRQSYEGRLIERAADCRNLFQMEWNVTHFDLVIHCAATIPSIEERAKSGLSVANDFGIDSALFQWASRARPTQLVYFSSCVAYPGYMQFMKRPLQERDIDLNALAEPDSLYGHTKLVGELQARELRKEGVDVRVFRPFSGYGHDQSLNYPFPSMIERALRREDPFIVWGSGEQRRDFVHVDDIVALVLKACKRPDPETLNIGTGIATSMFELAKLVCSEAGYDPHILNDAYYPSGNAHLQADVGQMNYLHPAGITLRSGVKHALMVAQRRAS